MNQVYLLIGGNLGDREKHLADARQLIGKTCGKILRTSSIYETAAWGYTEQPDFLNQVIEMETTLDPHTLMDRLLKLEMTLGRSRKEKNGPRTIDLDILFFNDDVIDTKLVQIPHPRLTVRRFVLTPLQELAPRKKHPVSGFTLTKHLRDCPDPLPVKKYSTPVQNK